MLKFKNQWKKVNEYAATLNYQIESLKYKTFFLRHEPQGKNVLTKYKWLAITAGDMDLIILIRVLIISIVKIWM